MDDEQKPDPIAAIAMSVSRRHFIQGVIATGVSVSAATCVRREPDVAASPVSPGAEERAVVLTVNGQERRVNVASHETLAVTLRNRLGLTGTKLGCEHAECGACTVLLDDVPHYSCSILTHSVRGRAVTTIEGVARPDGTLHPVQQAAVDEQAFQCGYCAPGYVLATIAFLKENPNPTRDELAHGVSGNLCRCHDYDKILTAMMRAAEYSRRNGRV